MRKTGIDVIGDVPWGTHLCQFYQTKEDLIDLLVPYFKAGLENNEFCMWVTSDPLAVGEASDAMKKALPNFTHYAARGQIEIIPYTEWYLKNGVFHLEEVLNGWITKLNQALAKGYDGMRITGNTAWLEKKDWKNFSDYEEAIDTVLSKYHMMAICSYPLASCGVQEIIDVVRNHEIALIKREGKLEIFESTGRKRARKALRESEEKYRTLYETIKDGIVATDMNGHIIECNQAYRDMLGYSHDELKRLTYQQITPEKWHHMEAHMVKEIIMVKGYSDEYEKEYIRKDRTVFPISIRIWLMKDSAGKPKGMWGFVRDITEHKRMEGELLKLSNAVKQSSSSIIITDAKGRIEYVNPNFIKLTGYTFEEVIGKSPGILKSGQTSPEEYQRLWTTITSGNEWRGEFINRKKDGNIYCEFASISPIKNAKGIITHFVAIKEDITKRKQMEEELREQRDQLERLTGRLTEANKELEAFSYSVSHDLREPLRSIDGFGRALLEDSPDTLDDQGKNYLNRMIVASRRMGQLINDLLKLSRITRGEMSLSAVDLSAMARSIATELQEKEPERQVECIIAKELTAHGDPQLLRIALENLLANAWKFTKKCPRAVIEFGIVPYNGKPAYFVRDNGVGFDMAYAYKLFIAFQRLHALSEFEGTGIGLATVQRIIHRHGGKIWAESETGKGATFYFRL